MGIFSKNKQKEKLILVLDIRSSSVGGSLFFLQKTGIPKILYMHRENIPLIENLEIEHFFDFTLKTLDSVVNKIYKLGMGAPDHIYCVLSSPWHIGETRIINFNKNTPFVFTSIFADSLIQKEITLVKEEYLSKYKNENFRFYELKNMKVSLNGYHLENPLNKKAKELEMNLFISFSPENILNRIEEKIAKYFNYREIKFSSFILPSFTLIRDFYIDKKDFILVDVGAEMTDIFIVKDNSLRDSVSFPFGVNFMIRELSLSFKCSLDEARTYLELLKNNHLDKVNIKRFNKIVDILKRKWLENFEQALARMSTNILLPSNIYLFTDKNFQNFFMQIMKNEEFNQYSLTYSKFKITSFGLDIFHNLVEFKGDVLRDPNLIIDAIYINRFLN